jgi:two-component system, NarL family, response regulator LiaR
MNKYIRIVIADDQHLIRYGLRELIDHEPDMIVVGEAASNDQALSHVLKLTPDILLLDLMMPSDPELGIIAEIRHLCPQTHILILSGLEDEEAIFRSLQLGATAFLPKTTAPAELVDAIRAAMSNTLSLHPKVARVVMHRLNQPAAPPLRFTPRERTVLRLLVQGLSNNEIARALSLSEHTVRTHVCHVLGKLNVDNRTQAVLHLLKHKLIEFGDEE